MTIFGGIGHEPVTERERLALAREVHKARIDAARTKTTWEEVAGADLVRRERRWLVHVPTDRIFIPHRGAVFGRGSASIEFTDPKGPFAFYVDEDGDVVLLDRVSSFSTGSELVERRVRQQHLRAAG